MRVISLGWGVQSWALAAMSALGMLPPVDAAVHADTTYERSETYEHATKWTPWLISHGIKVVTVYGDLPPESWPDDEHPGIYIPAYTLSEKGEKGQLFRQCTDRWKIRAVRRWIRKQNIDTSIPGAVDLWLGITLDEVTRMKPSDVNYIINIFPFLEMLNRPWTRGMVMCWLTANGLDIPVKSACKFCVFRDRAGWRKLQRANDENWQKALVVDQAIRHKRPRHTCYLTPARKPLVECDFRSQQDHGQLTLWEEEECSGMCFL